MSLNYIVPVSECLISGLGPLLLTPEFDSSFELDPGSTSTSKSVMPNLVVFTIPIFQIFFLSTRLCKACQNFNFFFVLCVEFLYLSSAISLLAHLTIVTYYCYLSEKRFFFIFQNMSKISNYNYELSNDEDEKSRNKMWAIFRVGVSAQPISTLGGE